MPTQDYRKIFANNLRKARKSKKLSQADFSKMTGFTQSYISEIENSKRPITIDVMGIIADTLNTPLSELLL